jgi:predicted metal-dependent phosphoesterase TrpH
MYRGLIHFHSCYSYDSISSIESIVAFALKNGINFLILTDHDTIDGSRELKAYVDRHDIDLEVLIAAEYKTEFGDVIAAGIHTEIVSMKFENFINEVRAQGGIILFPHPFVGHKNIEKIAAASDMIEVFNSRVSDELNQRSLELAIKYNKPIYYTSDAHTVFELKNSIIEFDNNGGLLKSLILSNIDRVTSRKTRQYEVLISQFIKSFKKRNARLFVFLLYYLLRNFSKIVKSV